MKVLQFFNWLLGVGSREDFLAVATLFFSPTPSLSVRCLLVSFSSSSFPATAASGSQAVSSPPPGGLVAVGEVTSEVPSGRWSVDAVGVMELFAVDSSERVLKHAASEDIRSVGLDFCCWFSSSSDRSFWP